MLFDQQEGSAKTGGLLLIGKDITIRDSSGQSDWWNEYAGPACKLWRRAYDIASGDYEGAPNDWLYDRVTITEKYGGFVDFWCVVLQHKEVILACIFLVYVVDVLLKPRVLCVMSDKVSPLVDIVRMRSCS
jgi:hypothetical protein